jgi:hypothetical protein
MAANTRIMYDNIAERGTITASTYAGVLVPANLVASRKSKVWRSTGTSATLSVVLAAAEVASMVALPFCDLTSASTIRVRLYSDAAGANLVLDTAAQSACPAQSLQPRGFTTAQAANAYAYGGGAYARIWFTPTSFMKAVIDIADAGNPLGFIESSYLWISNYWEVPYNPSSSPVGWIDDSSMSSSRAGDQMVTSSWLRRRLSIDLTQFPATDRTKMVTLLRNSRAYPILISVFPGSTDLELERDYFILGRRPRDSDIAIEMSSYYSVNIPIEEV